MVKHTQTITNQWQRVSAAIEAVEPGGADELLGEGEGLLSVPKPLVP
jgi:hypothetical protein